MVRRSADVRKTAAPDWPEPEAAGDSCAGTGAVETLTAASSPRRQNRGCIAGPPLTTSPGAGISRVYSRSGAPPCSYGESRGATARRAGSAAAVGAMQKPHQMAEIEFRARGAGAEGRGERGCPEKDSVWPLGWTVGALTVRAPRA